MEETTTTITAVKQEVKMRDWAEQIEAQQASGMPVQKWCEENEINTKTYYYHLRKLREKCVVSAPAIVFLAVSKQTDDINYPKIITDELWDSAQNKKNNNSYSMRYSQNKSEV